ncbi:MAG: zinc-binding dehydrogenase [Clostridia bacterium]|nr:zinc-binding dehydrogenase [Clostridia bacterium]
MKGYCVHKDGRCAIEELPVPSFGQYEALVKMESCGVCNGTDMKIIHAVFKGIDTYPVVLGHEGVGRVVKIGKGVTSFAVGDLVLLPFNADMPEGYTSGWGTFSEYGTVADAEAMAAAGLDVPDYAYAQKKLPCDFDPVAAAMIVTFREVYSTMKRFGFAPGKSLVVLGLGPVGHSFVQFAKFIGMSPVIAIDRVDEKLEKAKAYGAELVIDNSKEVDLVAQVKSLCPDGVDFVLDAVGVSAFINTALSMIKPDAKVCVYGISANMSQEIDWSVCPYNWTLHFHQFPSKLAEGEVHDEIVSWIAEGKLDPMDYISHVYAFDDIDKAYDNIHNRVPTMKMVVKF